MQRSLHIFRRDLRLEDNTALLYSLTEVNETIPCFIFDPRQIKTNEYFSAHAFEFMLSSLQELKDALQKKGGKLFLFWGEPEAIVATLLSQKALGITQVTINRDYTPFSRNRDAALKKVIESHGALMSTHHDALINEPEDVFKKDGTAYTIFTPFMKRAVMIPVRSPEENDHTNYYNGKITDEVSLDFIEKKCGDKSSSPTICGGRSRGVKLLKELAALNDYTNKRDYPIADYTSHLSAHHKFGTLSIRETYAQALATFGRGHPFINQLYWRDFFTHIAHHFPHVFGSAFQKHFQQIPWENNQKKFKAWCEGRTGFPIVDAGMRELNTTGFMHNRARMITASFLVKDLHIDWRWGEKYFAQKLVDYDPCVNNGSWQWAASTGCDAQPYFRIFNPWRQQERFDPECKYILQWLPELHRLTPKEIHRLEKERKPLLADDYPAPIVNHSLVSTAAKELFKKTKERYT